ncbi:MAG TPA: OmpA family protein [Pseudomonas sp.]|jgi:chemotaxis protein MotB|uniref:OmpA/MotB family protein n=1 Tax=Pseudomonas sp. TaxID=306 RepID=UPI002EDB7D01
MRPSSSAARPRNPAEFQHFLDRQGTLEIELMQARQSHRGLKRKHAAALAASMPSTEEAGGDAWMMTYLDMMTLLLVVTMAMLALAGKGHTHTQKPGFNLNAMAMASVQTHVDQPGSLLLVPQAKPPRPAEQEPKRQLIGPVETQTASIEVVTSVPATIQQPPAEPGAEDLLKELHLDQLGDDIEVLSNDRSISFRINNEILFPSGQTDLNLGGLKVLQKLIPVLDSVSYKIIVAGHTDKRDIHSSRFPSNWELSGARAGSVVRYLQSNGIKSERLAAVGYADTRPLADNSTTQGRASNRRVELILER